MFRKILIANRGEIALRIIRTCKRLGVKTVAIYSDPDVESRHVLVANESYRIGAGDPSDSYLSKMKIVEAAKKSGSEGVHPGYGFLAENPGLAKACEEAALTFIGPNSRVLQQVADKLESKKVVAKAGIPVIPGSLREINSLEDADSEARRIGFPVLVKAVLGGGGRGMRVVRGPRELKTALERAGAEAKMAFGHSELYMEKYLDKPRHIEVQVLASGHGRTIHLGERECSLQRRYQKILEETPSPVLNDKERKRLQSLALKVAKATEYENAGTVEFIRSRKGELYYLETNKRIQVEHLITELVTGIDIVEEQLRIACGDGLNVSQDEVSFSGAAINCRINAEDPARGFAPTPGKVTKFVSPGGLGVRVDTALFDGCPVPEFYDSLIAKVACLGRHREETIRRMRVALEETFIEGVKTTISLQQTLLENRLFVNGEYHTQLLDQLLSDWQPKQALTPDETAAVYIALKRSAENSRLVVAARARDQSKWRMGLEPRSVGRRPLYVEGV